MKTFGFDYLMVATLADTRISDERQDQHFRELRREAERQERNRLAWKARWDRFRYLFINAANRAQNAGNGGRVATAS